MNTSKPLLNVFFYAVILIFGGILSSKGQEYDTIRFELKNQEMAIQKAIEYTGFNKSSKFSYDSSLGNIELGKIIDTTTAFFHNEITDKIAWSIEFKNILLNPAKVEPLEIQAFPRTFIVNIDAETGELLTIRSVLADCDKASLFPQDLEKEEKSILNGSEKYIGLVKDVPNVNFYEAINSDSYGASLRTKIIDAICVNNSRLGKEAIPMWIFTLNEPRALPSDYDYRHNKPGKWVRKSRILVDANSGNVIITKKRFYNLEWE